MIGPLADYAAILSDLDGTLVDSDAAVRRAWTAFAHRHELDADAVVREAAGRPAAEVAVRLAPDAPDEPELIAAQELSDTDGIVALPGAADLLHAPSLTVAVVTSCSRRLALARLRAAGLPVPATLVTADQLARGKPDPEGYLRAAHELGVDAAACLVLEDAPAGVRAGRAAGMTVVAVRTSHPDAELADADAIVDGLPALL